MSNSPSYQDFKEAWVQYSTWKRTPTCGRAQAEAEFENFIIKVENAAMGEFIWGSDG